jgi:hypothetical protein
MTLTAFLDMIILWLALYIYFNFMAYLITITIERQALSSIVEINIIINWIQVQLQGSFRENSMKCLVT